MNLYIISLGVLLFSATFVHAEVDRVLARATAYHKTEPNCDPDTKKGKTSTQIKLRDNRDYTIGMVAVDPQKIPYGSLIYAHSNKRFYLACDTGGHVRSAKASKLALLRSDIPNEYAKALVLDFYSKHEIVDNHFDHFIVIRHQGRNFKTELRKAEQELRLSPQFWLEKVRATYSSGDHSEFSEDLREMVERLTQMSRT